MIKNSIFALLFTVFMACPLMAQKAETIRSSDHVAGEILFQLNDYQAIKYFEETLNNKMFNGKTTFKIEEIAPTLHIYSLTFDPTIVDESTVLTALKKDPSVSAVQFNHPVELRGTPNDPLFAQQVYLQKINAPSAWDVTTGGVTACGDTIVVAVIDGGFQPNISDLRDNIWTNKGEIPNNGIDDDKNTYIDDYRGLNTFNLSDNHVTGISEDGVRHGTACAGLIGASGNNNKLVTGVNWKIKLLLFSGILQAGGDSYIIKAYDYVLYQRRLYDSTGGKKGAFIPVTSMSAGFPNKTPDDFPLLCKTYETLYKAGILSIVSAINGNEKTETAGDMPTLCNKEGLIIVTSTDNNDVLKASFSPKYVHLAAPGEDILFLTPDEQTYNDGGTSYAAPLVAGAAALLWSMPEKGLCALSKTQPQAAANRVKDAILRGVDKSQSLTGKTVTNGRLNIKQSLNLLRRSFGQPIGDFDIVDMFPNPTVTELRIKLQLPEKTTPDILITNVLGQIVYQKKYNSTNDLTPFLTINTENFAAGLYVLSMRTLDFEVAKKFVVVKK